MYFHICCLLQREERCPFLSFGLIPVGRVRLSAWLGLPCPGELCCSVGTAWLVLCRGGSRADGLLQQAQLIAVLLRWLHSPVMYFGKSHARYTPISEPGGR